jgi:ketosteroid isomerase-like protein
MTGSDSEIGWRASTVLHRYCAAIDQHDAAALAEVFGKDVALVVGGGDAGAEQSFTGRDTVVTILASLFEQRRWARHMVSNVVVEPGTDGTVAVRSYFQFVLGLDGAVASGVGDYDVTMREEEGRLVITRFSAAILDQATTPRSEADAG